MIVVHHLNDSRSQRILWLLEELELPYRIEHHQRDAQTRLAPPSLQAVHPLGKSPVIVDDGLVLHESGAIVDYILRRHGDGRLQPDPASQDFDRYVEWLHYAEGSAMLPLMIAMYTGRLKEAAAPLRPRIESEADRHLGFVDQALAGREFLVGDALTGADIQMSFVGEVAKVQRRLEKYPNLTAWLDRLHARPAFKASVEKGGAYSFG